MTPEPEPDPEPTTTKLSIYSVSPNATSADDWVIVDPELITNQFPTVIHEFSAYTTDDFEVQVGKQYYIGHQARSLSSEELTVPNVGVVPTSQFTNRRCFNSGSALYYNCATVTPTSGSYFMVGVYASGSKGVENDSENKLD